MNAHAKSFSFARKIFNRKITEKVIYLYRFCRFVDDCADELPPLEAKKAVEKIKESFNSQNDSLISKDISYLKSMGIKKEHLLHLIEGASMDSIGPSINNNKDLIQYCYMVAGVVGLMMCPIMNVSNKNAYKHAIDLGIAMQITNICRDILQDAQNKRTYLPLDILTAEKITIDTLNKKGNTPLNLKNIVKSYLNLADQYYTSGYNGLSYIPLRARLCILIAGEIYRSIGIKIRRENYDVLKGRTILSRNEKFFVLLKSTTKIFNKNFWHPQKHNSKLHVHLKEILS